jgi:hypothetical protein
MQQNTLRLLLYYDEIEVKNPLGDAAGVYKLGMFYFTILNLTRKHNSRLNNIYVAAISYADDLKKYGINRVLNHIVNDVKDLETSGIKVKDEHYYASIAQVSGDNLGIHQLFGLKCCFSSKCICHLCSASVESIQNNYFVNNFIKENKQSYESKLKQIQEDPNIKLDTCIKSYCALNELKYFHITKNVCFDVMHDIWEGVAPLEISLIFYQFIYIDKYFDLNLLNERIKLFNYGMVEKKNKPGPIRLDSGKLKVKQTATKMFCLFRALPFIISDKIPKENEHWELYLILCKIIDIIYTIDVDLTHISELELHIQDHHHLFKKLFPDINLRKKHHNMLHYPNGIKELGNIIDYMSLRFEGKHPFPKKAANTIHNTNNVLYSVAKKLQIYNCYNLVTSNLLNLKEEIISYNQINFNQLEIQSLKDLISNQIGLQNNILICNKVQVKVYGQLYKNNMFVLVKMENNKIGLNKIIEIIILNGCVYFYLQLFECFNFDLHLHSHEIQKTNKFFLLKPESLYHYRPFDSFQNLDPNDNRLFVRPNCLI